MEATTKVICTKTVSVIFSLTFLLVTASAGAALTGKFTHYKMTWDGITRYYLVYVPLNLPPNPALVMMLHGTSYSTTPPITKNWGWWTLADTHHFIEVQPAATRNTATGAWNWNAYFLDAAFQTSPGPDDSGFLRQLITNLTTQYALNPKQIYVAGFSSGAEMAQRVGVEISDLVTAIIPASGQISAVPRLPIVLPGPPQRQFPCRSCMERWILFCHLATTALRSTRGIPFTFLQWGNHSITGHGRMPAQCSRLHSLYALRGQPTLP